MQVIKTNLSIITNVITIVISMASVLVFAWRFDYIDDIYVKVLLTLIAVPVLIALFFGQARRVFEIDKAKHALLWMSLPVTLLIFALISMYIERLVSLVPSALALNIGFLFILVFPGFIYYLDCRKAAFFGDSRSSKHRDGLAMVRTRNTEIWCRSGASLGIIAGCYVYGDPLDTCPPVVLGMRQTYAPPSPQGACHGEHHDVPGGRAACHARHTQCHGCYGWAALDSSGRHHRQFSVQQRSCSSVQGILGRVGENP